MFENKPNQYIHYRDDFDLVHHHFDPTKKGCLKQYGYTYIETILRKFEKLHRNSGLVFYVTSWTVQHLPSYGDNVIVIIMLDEFNREVKYRDKVGAVFRTFGVKPVFWHLFKYGTPIEKFASILSLTRSIAKDGLTGRIKFNIMKAFGAKLAPVYDLPLGYYANDPVEYVDFDARPMLMSFSGSVQHRVSKTRVPSPKRLARNRMIEALVNFKENYPDLPIECSTTANFKASIAGDGTYTQQLMNSKFCLVPRGTNLDTYRFYEALRFGCIPIMELVPRTVFYEGAPIIRLNDWSELQEKIVELLKQPQKVRDLHEQALNWWKLICSEDAVARQISNHVNNKTVDYRETL